MEADVRRVLARLTLDARGLQKAFQSPDPEVWDRAIARVVTSLANVSDVDWTRIAGTAVTRLDWDPQSALADMQNKLSLVLQTSDLDTAGRRAAAVNRVLGLKARVENMVEDVRHTGAMIAIEDEATEAGKYLVWMPERNACPRCLDLGGAVVAPGGDFVGMGLLGDETTTARRPPLHKNCRCELKAISPDDAGGFAAGIKREAARSAALGKSSYASPDKLSELAGQVAKVGVPLPKTVLAKARVLAAKENKPTTPLRRRINEARVLG